MRIASLYEIAAGVVLVNALDEGSLPDEAREHVNSLRNINRTEQRRREVKRVVRINNVSLAPLISSRSLAMAVEMAVRSRRMTMGDALMVRHATERKSWDRDYCLYLERVIKKLMDRGDWARVRKYNDMVGAGDDSISFQYCRLLSAARTGDLPFFRETQLLYPRSVKAHGVSSCMVQEAVKSGNIAMVRELGSESLTVKWYECLGISLARKNQEMVDLCYQKIQENPKKPGDGRSLEFSSYVFKRSLTKAMTRGHLEIIDYFLTLFPRDPLQPSALETVVSVAIKNHREDLIDRWWHPDLLTSTIIRKLAYHSIHSHLRRIFHLSLDAEIPVFSSVSARKEWAFLLSQEWIRTHEQGI